MKTFIIFFLASFLLLPIKAQDARENFFGMWTLSIEDGTVGWLNVHKDKGYLDAELLWVGGSVTPVSNVYFRDDNKLIVTRSNERTIKQGDDVRKFINNQVLCFSIENDTIKGLSFSPQQDRMSVEETKFIGWELPQPTTPPNLSNIVFGNPIELFNGVDLSGWRLIDPKQTNGFKVVDGILVNDPVQYTGSHISYGNIRTINEFEDFNLKLEVSVPEGSNSGVYLRGLYEVQVLDSYGRELDSHNMGALYSRITPSMAAEKPAGEWQVLDITLYKRHVTVRLNGKEIISNKPVFGPTGGAISADVNKAGPIYLQGDHGKVKYRNIVLKPIMK